MKRWIVERSAARRKPGLRRLYLGGKHLFGGGQPVERSGKAGIHRHLHDGLDDFITRAAHIERALDMHLELWRGVAQRGKCGDHGNFSAFQVKPRAVIDVAKRKFDQVAGKVRRNVSQVGDDLFPYMSVHLAQFG